MAIAGLKLITPTSVAGTGVSLSGAKVEFTSASSVSVNGVFTSAYDNYIAVIRHWNNATSGNPSMRMRLRVGGADATGANTYVFQYFEISDGTRSAARSTSDLFNISESSPTARSGTHVYFYGPHLAQPTAYRSVTCDGRLNAYINDNAGTQSASTSYDGFTIFPSSDSINGSITIYGLAQ